MTNSSPHRSVARRPRRSGLGVLAALAALAAAVPASAGDAPIAPDRVSVLPIFFVPDGMPQPTGDQADALMAHLAWAQDRFGEMLDCRGTFSISSLGPVTIDGDRTLGQYIAMPEGGVPAITGEVLEHLGHDRFGTPFIHLMVVMNPAADVPPGGGRPCNGGFNTGGGVVVLSSHALDQVPNFQSTLQHELGHAFGLPHVDVYGYSMQTSASIMSYNLAHHTDGFEPSDEPGVLIPEDIRGLAWNDRAFPRLAFDPASDVPPGWSLADAVWLGPMSIPGQPANIVGATTTSGETFGSSVDNIVQGRIRPSAGPGVNFDPASMWHSDETPTGWVRATLVFPAVGPVELDRVRVHSEHSGQYHRAERAIVEVFTPGAAGFVTVADRVLNAADADVPFDAPAAGTTWRIRLQAGSSDYVVVRGLQFFRGDAELFPPFIPDPTTEACRWDLDENGTLGIGDLLSVLAGWDAPDPGPADVDCDGTAGINDLLLLLGNWSACD